VVGRRGATVATERPAAARVSPAGSASGASGCLSADRAVTCDGVHPPHPAPQKRHRCKTGCPRAGKALARDEHRANWFDVVMIRRLRLETACCWDSSQSISRERPSPGGSVGPRSGGGATGRGDDRPGRVHGVSLGRSIGGNRLDLFGRARPCWPNIVSASNRSARPPPPRRATTSSSRVPPTAYATGSRDPPPAGGAVGVMGDAPRERRDDRRLRLREPDGAGKHGRAARA